MARKKRKGKAKPFRVVAPPRFAIGDAVRVKSGIRAPEFADIPLGGWAGTITEVDSDKRSHLYLVSWNERTLAAIPEVYRKRCERDGCEPDMWLGEEDLEPDVGEPPPIEQPTEIVTRPLSHGLGEDRVRMVFGLTSDDPLPDIDDDRLRQYHDYLTQKLRFPFKARLIELGSFMEEGLRKVTVERLLGADEIDLDDGILCEVEEDGERFAVPLSAIEVSSPYDVRRAIQDYAFWFVNWPQAEDHPDRLPPPDSYDEPDTPDPTPPMSVGRALLQFIVIGAVYGAVLGTMIGVFEGASIGAIVGAILLALIGMVLGSSIHVLAGRAAPYPGEQSGSVATGLMFGGTVGGLLGALILAWKPALIGAVAALVIGTVLPESWKRAGGRWVVFFLLPVLVAVGWGWWQDPAGARIGTLVGAGIGAASGPLVILLVGVVDVIATSYRGER